MRRRRTEPVSIRTWSATRIGEIESSSNTKRKSRSRITWKNDFLAEIRVVKGSRNSFDGNFFSSFNTHTQEWMIIFWSLTSKKWADESDKSPRSLNSVLFHEFSNKFRSSNLACTEPGLVAMLKSFRINSLCYKKRGFNSNRTFSMIAKDRPYFLDEFQSEKCHRFHMNER